MRGREQEAQMKDVGFIDERWEASSSGVGDSKVSEDGDEGKVVSLIS